MAAPVGIVTAPRSPELVGKNSKAASGFIATAAARGHAS
jgi:hypothetical protein